MCGFIKPGHTLIMVDDRSLIGLTMRDSAKIIADAADRVKSSQGRVPCVFRFMKTEMVDSNVQLSPTNSESAGAGAGAPEKRPGLLARCLPKVFGASKKKGDKQ